MKKILAIALALMLLLGAASFAPANADTEEKYGPKGRVVVYTASSQDQQDLEKELWDAMYPDCEL